MTLFCPTFRSSIIKACALFGFIVAAPLAGAIPAHAQTPNQILYFYSGVHDSGGAANTGRATSIHCSNFSGVPVAVQFLVYAPNSNVLANQTAIIGHTGTVTAATKFTGIYIEDLNLNTGALSAGLAAVVGSNPYVVCTAQVLDAGAVVPVGFALHGVRFNPIAGTQE